MKKVSRAALSLLAVMPGLAPAQSSVQVSGVIDAGVRMDSGSTRGSVTSVGSGQRDPSRITFSGIEDLGGGLKAGFILESGVGVDIGAGINNPPGTASGPLTWGRLSTVTLGSDATGYLSLGRQYTPMWAISAGPANDPFGAGWLAGIANVYSFTVRASNSLVYSYGYTAQTTLLPAPPKGLGAMLMYSLAETSTPSSNAGRQFGGNVSYGDGVWWLGYGYHQVNGSNTSISPTAPVSDAPTVKQQTLGASYQLAWGRVHVGLNSGKNGLTGAGALDRLNWHIGANLLFDGRHPLRVLVGKSRDRTATHAEVTTLQIGYGYDLSKRTALYAAVGQMDNNSTSAAALGGAIGTYAPGSTPRSVITGIRHLF